LFLNDIYFLATNQHSLAISLLFYFYSIGTKEKKYYNNQKSKKGSTLLKQNFKFFLTILLIWN